MASGKWADAPSDLSAGYRDTTSGRRLGKSPPTLIFLTSRENKFVPISLASAKANRARLATGLAFARKLVPL